MYEILATDSAGRDLDEIRNYLINVLCNPLALENLHSAIWKAYQTLCDNPYAFPKCDDARLAKMGYRKCALHGYLFVYSVDEAEHVIHVIRYFHGLQNYQGLL